MHVIATAGHVDHGKSTLVKALTGADPDRLEEERRRGLSIELGYVWTTLDPVGEVAFVDVPGHERFLRTMLAGVGPVPAVLLVVAADDPWMPQAAEHLAALDALGVRHGVVAVSRSDLADPAPMLARARDEVERTTLRGAPVVAVSGVTGAGLDDLRMALVELVRSVGSPSPDADVRLWVDRLFHVRGSGTVVTGTLPAGTVAVGDRLTTGDGSVRVRGVQSLGRPREAVSSVARVALNVVGDDAGLARDSVLVTPGGWHFTETVDVRLGDGEGRVPEQSDLHVGAVGVPTRLRPFDETTARLTLTRPLPLRVGDRALLRDPGSRRVWGVTVLDPAPPQLRRRGAGARRARLLATATGRSSLDEELDRRGVVSTRLLRQIGVPVPADADEWLVGAEAADLARARMLDVVKTYDDEHPLAPGMPVPALARALALPSPDLITRLVAEPLRLEAGRVTSTPPRTGLPDEIERAVRTLEDDLADAPFEAPTADRLRELGLHPKAIGVAARAGRLLDLGSGIVLLPGADLVAARWLAELDQPFTTSAARQRLATTRRVVLPLLARLDSRSLTTRHPDDRRSVR
ncbi:MAG TPA: SelB C-terminal domain-containing protein [Marmoricola sp.]|nr:SelB C-terminal domain-containing protein [Marmoricola sp.]